MPDLRDDEISIKINSIKDFKAQLGKNNIDNCLFIPYMTYNYKVIKLFRLLTRTTAQLAFFRHGLFPVPGRKSIKEQLRNVSTQKIIKIIARIIYSRAFYYKKCGYIKEYDIVFAAGKKAEIQFGQVEQLIPVNLNDYDNYLEEAKNEKRLLGNKYCVFLDQDFISHPDRKVLGYKELNSDHYYSTINKFFDNIEDQFGCEVVVAASPKSEYKNNVFGGRKIFEGNTNKLIKYCLFSIAVTSTAVSYPVCYKKPILFFSYSGFSSDGSAYDMYSKNFAKTLDCSHYDIDSLGSSSPIHIKSVNNERYDSYKYTYLTSKQSENKPTVEIVIDFLDQYRENKCESNEI